MNIKLYALCAETATLCGRCHSYFQHGAFLVELEIFGWNAHLIMKASDVLSMHCKSLLSAAGQRKCRQTEVRIQS